MNFDIINHKCRGDKLQGTYKNCKTVKNEDLTIIQKVMLKLSYLLLFEIKGMIYGLND